MRGAAPLFQSITVCAGHQAAHCVFPFVYGIINRIEALEDVSMQTDCVILGGGAGGLCAAAALGRRGLRVTVVERLPRVGKKLLATGNGRCNLSNLDMQPSHYGKAAAVRRAGLCRRAAGGGRRLLRFARPDDRRGGRPRLSPHDGRLRRARRAAHGLASATPSRC